MFKKTLFILFLTLSFIGHSVAEDKPYELLSPAQPTQNPDKIEVIEFFWYGCPHCYSFEPMLAEWLKNKPDNVEFIRQPAIFSRLWELHAKAYYTAEALGVLDKVHTDLFDAIQNKHQKLADKDELAEFFVAHGVDKAAFEEAYDSFLVDAKLRQARAMAPRYGVTGVPTIIVNGKYKVTARLAKSQQNMIKVINDLIQKESTESAKP
jgi:thiol:disulfide interchange protein DsbA